MNNDELAAIRETMRTKYQQQKHEMRKVLPLLREMLMSEQAKLEDEFVADNVEMMFERARYRLSQDEHVFSTLHMLVGNVAEDMRGINGANYPYSADEVMEYAAVRCGVSDEAA